MVREIKIEILAVALAIVGAFIAGRYSVPEKVRIETKIVEVEKKTTDTKIDQDTHKVTKVVQTEKPDGTKETTTTTTEDTSKDTNTDTKTEDTTIVNKEEEEKSGNSSKVTVSALAGFGINPFTPVYGASISKPVIGPITLGGFILTSGVGGVSIGLTF